MNKEQSSRKNYKKFIKSLQKEGFNQAYWYFCECDVTKDMMQAYNLGRKLICRVVRDLDVSTNGSSITKGAEEIIPPVEEILGEFLPFWNYEKPGVDLAEARRIAEKLTAENESLKKEIKSLEETNNSLWQTLRMRDNQLNITANENTKLKSEKLINPGSFGESVEPPDYEIIHITGRQYNDEYTMRVLSKLCFEPYMTHDVNGHVQNADLRRDKNKWKRVQEYYRLNHMYDYEKENKSYKALIETQREFSKH